MSQHPATITWTYTAVGDDYSRNHLWTVADGLEIPASAASVIVPPPLSEAGRIDPEAGFVASIASCHMLWFLSLAQARGYRVMRYIDHAIGTLGRDAAGRLCIKHIVLSPRVAFADATPTVAAHEELHRDAHARCFLAHSINAEIVIRPVVEQTYV